MLAVWEEKEHLDAVLTALHGHKERVNCVKWITARKSGAASPQTLELLSGSVDKSVILWQRTEGAASFCLAQTLCKHSGPVTCLSATYVATSTDQPYTLIASGSSDSTVVIWRREGLTGNFSVTQTISLNGGFVFGIDWYILPTIDEPLLATGGDNALVTLLASKDHQFVKVLSLAGHEDWVRDLHFAQDDSGDVLLASCSHDTYIRLWRMTSRSGRDQSSDDLALKGNTFSVGNSSQPLRSFEVKLDALLIGHEDWIYSIQWQPVEVVTPVGGASPSVCHQPMCLLSASMDKMMMLWRPDPASGVWVEQVRVGEVGGNTLGLYGGVFSPDGRFIVAHGYQGAFHLWQKSGVPDEEGEEEGGRETWRPKQTLGGHFGPVQDIGWEPKGGRFLLSASDDQTTRLHAPWVHEGRKVTWHEIARPQIHGYGVQCLAMTHPFRYISGADEKILRVFDAPSNFFGNLSRISGVLFEVSHQLPLGASVPSLGLSNKAVFTDSLPQDEDDIATKNSFADQIPAFAPVDLSEPPVEDHLLQNTLWPEIHKLYGHGYEIFSVASSPDGCYVASGCKASKPEHAVIRVWETSQWHQVAALAHHSLTVTQLAFSHSGKHLLAVSRDRTWSLWKLDKERKECFALVAQLGKTSTAHARIIWCCSWTHDDVCFATASRDKRVALWSQQSVLEGGEECGEGWKEAADVLELEDSVTAVDFAPVTHQGSYLLAVGLESGQLLLYLTSLQSAKWMPLFTFPNSLCHTLTVKRLLWRPCRRDGDHSSAAKELVLSSCSLDSCVKVFSVRLE
eukprot:Em0004g156a